MNHSLDPAEFVRTLRVPTARGHHHSEPLVSVVMPSFNQAAFIERSILSVLNQDYCNIELIVIDGGSTDGTVEIIKRYAHALAFWRSCPDQGQSDALNQGFKRAQGEVMGWLNSDDLYLPGAVRSAVEALRAHQKVDVVFGDWLSIDADDSVIEEHPAFDFSLGHFVYEGFTHNAQGMFWTRAAHLRFGDFDVQLHRTMDYDLIIRLGMKEKFLRLPQALACFRRHEAQKTTGQDETVIREHRSIAERLGFGDKFRLRGKLMRLMYRARRGYWYAKRRNLVYALGKVSNSIANRIVNASAGSSGAH